MTEPAPGAQTAGGLLRAAREQQGMHIAALAAAIKVTPRKLDALENNRWQELPDATFTRALAQTVCRTLKIDARPVLELLPAVSPGSLDKVSDKRSTPFRERGPGADPHALGSAVKPLVWAGVLLLLAALAMFFVPAGWLPASLGGAAQTEVAAPAFPASAPLLPPDDTRLAVPAEPLLPATPDEQPAAEPAPGTGAAAVQAEAPPLPAAAAAAPAAPVVVPADELRLQTRGESWVEVRDANGRVLVSRLLPAGEDISLQGPLPLRLVVGNALAVQLSFRQQPVDLQPFTRDNVARLQLP